MLRDPCRRNIPAGASYDRADGDRRGDEQAAAMKAKVTSAIVRMIALNRPSS